MTRFSLSWPILLCLVICACQQTSWNNPYPEEQATANIYYDVFSERPKHLDPATSYSSNEYVFLGQIYEPPLQYHFLKRPYELIPLTSTAIPEPEYFDKEGNLLADTAPAEQVNRAVYRIQIKPGIFFQPHPAFARESSGKYLYHQLFPDFIDHIHQLSDFPETGTRELKSGDYVYQIKRLANPKVNSPIAGVMSKYILGFHEYYQQLQKLDNDLEVNYIDLDKYPLDGVRIIDDYTFEIILKQKYPQFIYWLAMPFFAPMPWEADRFYSQPGMKEKNIVLDWYPIGTGPFMLTENNPNLRMVMERNPNFHNETYPVEGEPDDYKNGFLADAGKTLPFIDKAIFSLEVESIPAWNKFLQGYYDTSGIQSDNFDQAVQFSGQGQVGLTPELKNKNIRLQTAVTVSTFYMGFNMNDDVVGGDTKRARLLRRALSIAVDYEEFISIFTNGRGIPAQGPIPPGIFGNLGGAEGINSYVYEWKNNKPERRPITEALALMKQAGYENGRDQSTGQPLVLYLDTPSAGPGAKANLDWYRKQFAKLGINLVIRATDYNRFQDKMQKGTAQIYTWGWNADYPDPENFLFLLYGPNSKVEYGGENASNYKNAEFDRLFNRMKNMNNDPGRQQVINQMIEILRHDAPWLWGFHPIGFSLSHSWYHNGKPNLMSNNVLKYKRIDPVLRQQLRLEWNKPVLWPIYLSLIILFLVVIPAWNMFKRRERSTAL